MIPSGRNMSFQEWAVAFGLLTPLVLGILAFIEKFLHKKKEPETEQQPAVVQGMTVATNSYVDELIAQLKKDLAEEKQENAILQARLNERNQNG
jgi:hypothetical protein